MGGCGGVTTWQRYSTGGRGHVGAEERDGNPRGPEPAAASRRWWAGAWGSFSFAAPGVFLLTLGLHKPRSRSCRPDGLFNL